LEKNPIFGKKKSGSLGKFDFFRKIFDFFGKISFILEKTGLVEKNFVFLWKKSDFVGKKSNNNSHDGFFWKGFCGISKIIEKQKKIKCLNFL
jgi:hypothetical protein